MFIRARWLNLSGRRFPFHPATRRTEVPFTADSAAKLAHSVNGQVMDQGTNLWLLLYRLRSLGRLGYLRVGLSPSHSPPPSLR